MIDLTGLRFGKLTVLNKVEETHPIKWRCLCDCGNEKDIDGASLRCGSTRSCGCGIAESARLRHLKHGMCTTKLYGVWGGMIQRCENKKHIDSKWYGMDEISVCEEWRHDFMKFYDWAMENGYRDGLSVDRINNSLGYSPDNCRLATPSEQANNRRTNLNYTHDGETKTLKQWANYFGIKYGTLYCRIKRGVPFEEAISK